MVFGFTARSPLTVVFISKLDDKARLVLPVSIRSKLNLASGDFVLLTLKGDKLELSKTPFDENGVRSSRNSWEVVSDG